MLLIDTMISNEAANVRSTTKDVRNLARTLAEVDPETFGLLRCHGVVKVPKEKKPHLLDFKFIFNVPAGLGTPKSLRAVLLSQTSYPLDDRLGLAKKLTSSVLFVHTVSFVHKNIRPETIIVFGDNRSEIGSPFLAGFEKVRLEEAQTFFSGDDVWDHNLYRHPSRQGMYLDIEYSMQHDIYSLGVVLLEIGLWTSFVSYSSASGPSIRTPSSILEPQDTEKSKHPLGTSAEIKEKVESLAQRRLPERMGKRYTDIVLQCLRCLDPVMGEDEDEDEKVPGLKRTETSAWTDDDGLVIGVKYIENILEKIQEITI